MKIEEEFLATFIIMIALDRLHHFMMNLRIYQVIAKADGELNQIYEAFLYQKISTNS